MDKILVSACLLGEKCKYSAMSNYNQNVVDFLRESGAEAVPVCPEVMGGLPTPRACAEIRDGRVVTKDGADVTAQFQKGAEEALRMARENHCGSAILKERSPSCGSGAVYDGTFTGTLKQGNGITARLLEQAGIRILGENDIGNF